MPLGGLGPWGWRASFARLIFQARAVLSRRQDPPPWDSRGAGAASPGSRRGLHAAAAAAPGQHAGLPWDARRPAGLARRFSRFCLLAPDSASVRQRVGWKGGTPGRRGAPGRCSLAFRGLWAPCSAASEEARGLPRRRCAPRARSASLGEAAARRPPRAGSSPARFGGPRSTPGGRPRSSPAPSASAVRAFALDEGEPNFGLITRES